MSYDDLYGDYLFAGQQIRSTLECCCHCQPIGRQSQCNDGLSYLYYLFDIELYRTDVHRTDVHSCLSPMLIT